LRTDATDRDPIELLVWFVKKSMPKLGLGSFFPDKKKIQRFFFPDKNFELKIEIKLPSLNRIATTQKFLCSTIIRFKYAKKRVKKKEEMENFEYVKSNTSSAYDVKKNHRESPKRNHDGSQNTRGRAEPFDS
jgi:hypothetical protein